MVVAINHLAFQKKHVTSWELGNFKDDFAFPKMGYVVICRRVDYSMNPNLFHQQIFQSSHHQEPGDNFWGKQFVDFELDTFDTCLEPIW